MIGDAFMSSSVVRSDAASALRPAAEDALALSRWEERLAALLSVIAGMVDVTGFFTLGNVFTAHVTGNLVVAAAATVRSGPVNPAQVLAIPVFMLALAAIWVVARASRRQGQNLARLLLWIQFLLIAGILIFGVIARPSGDPHGSLADVTAMMAVIAMACQYAVFRLAVPNASSTATMTGNLTNAVLAVMDVLSLGHPLMTADAGRLKRSLQLLAGFLLGCVVAAAAISWIGDWAWALPAALAGVAVVL
jgi:uncharacterized membrane protein YoaK (UPF0700 family)